MSNESDVILELEREWCRKLQEKDVDWIVNLFAKEGRQFPPGGDIVSGSAALRTAWETLANTDGLEMTWDSTEAHVAASGDMAYDFGAVTKKLPDGHVQAAKYVIVWIRVAGQWKVAADIFNSNS